MNIRQLEVFQAVCMELSFTRAADKLYMTQPAVSHVIAELEEAAGCRLFDRLGRRIALTGAGELFQQKAAQVLELFGELEGFGQADAAPIRLGATITIANLWLPDILERFCALSAAPVQVTVDRAALIEERLAGSGLDLALIEGPVRRPQLQYRVFSSYEMAIIASPAHPLAALEQVELDTLLAAKLLLREKGSAIRDAFDSALTLSGRSASPAWESVNTQALIQAARRNLGVAVAPAAYVAEDLAAGRLVQLAVPGLLLMNQNQVAYHRDKYLTPAMEALISCVETGQNF